MPKKNTEERMPQHVPRGLLRFLILKLLDEKKELTGSEIMKILHERSGERWQPSPGSIYPLLSHLEENDWIEVVRTLGKSKIYALTEEGCNHIKMAFSKKKKIHERSSLPHKIWEQIISPSDRARLYMSSIIHHVDELYEMLPELDKRSQVRLKEESEEIITRIQSMIAKIEE